MLERLRDRLCLVALPVRSDSRGPGRHGSSEARAKRPVHNSAIGRPLSPNIVHRPALGLRAMTHESDEWRGHPRED